jgi:hypothetical protein
LLNTVKVRIFIESHIVKTQVGNIFKHLQLPKYVPENSAHVQLAGLVERAHDEPDIVMRTLLLEQISNLGNELI